MVDGYNWTVQCDHRATRAGRRPTPEVLDPEIHSNDPRPVCRRLAAGHTALTATPGTEVV